MEPVLITAEEPDALAPHLDELGVPHHHVPLVRREATRDRPPEEGGLRAVVITSAAAARFAADLAEVVGELPVYAVGEATAAALRAAGIAVHETGVGTGADLLPRVPTPVLHVGAVDLSPGFARELAAVPHVRWAVYRTIERDDQGPALRAAAAWVVALASGSAARAYVASRGPIAGVRFVAIGPSTAAVTTELGLVVEAVASKPTGEDLAAACARVTRRTRRPRR